MRTYIGTAEIYRGGGYCVEHFLFKVHSFPARPRDKLWKIAKEWYEKPDEVWESAKVAYFERWSVSVRPGEYKEISPELFNELKTIIQAVE